MIWFALFQFLGFIGLIALTFLFCRLRKVGFWAFVKKYFKWALLAVLLVALAISIACAKPLYNSAHCYFRGVSMHADTKYSWYLGECQIKTKSGSYVPLGRTRGLPDGPDGGHDESADFYNY